VIAEKLQKKAGLLERTPTGRNACRKLGRPSQSQFSLDFLPRWSHIEGTICERNFFPG
jgi:hypothetical protein